MLINRYILLYNLMAYYEIAYIYLSLSCENFSTYIFY